MWCSRSLVRECVLSLWLFLFCCVCVCLCSFRAVVVLLAYYHVCAFVGSLVLFLCVPVLVPITIAIEVHIAIDRNPAQIDEKGVLWIFLDCVMKHSVCCVVFMAMLQRYTPRGQSVCIPLRVCGCALMSCCCACL
eukprot:GHVQ01003435.1.p1 GENE.GHVQ01003435.1~~GHVQ01003435.1.p1  ORF type:complete len:135 (+),score=12.57 GHVQ01003435.1:421-825(+)